MRVEKGADTPYHTGFLEVRDTGRGMVGKKKKADTEEGNRATENTCLFHSIIYSWPRSRPWGRQRTRGEVRAKRDTDFQLGICPEVSCLLPTPHQTYANGNGNKLR